MTQVLTGIGPGDSRAGRWFSLDAEREASTRAQFHDTIARYANSDISPADYHVRGMMLCNGARDYYYSRFTPGALDEIAELLPGAPVMRSHDYRSEPVGTFFAARRVEVPGREPARDRQWVEAMYYLPSDEAGTALARRIDLGIQREVSIGWSCAGADCSQCGDPIWACRHIPGDIYSRGVCEFGFSGVTQVLEGSFVFRGGQKDTSTFTPEGAAPVTAGAASLRSAAAPGTDALDWALVAAAKRANGAPNGRAVGMGTLFGETGLRSRTQRVLCSRDRFESSADAARWVRAHEFRADRRTDEAAHFAFEQFPIERAKERSWKQHVADEGVDVMTCELARATKDDTSTASSGSSLAKMFTGR